jgi:hypothetical protein
MFDYSDDEDVQVATGPSQGQELPVRHNEMVQANAGYGNAASYPLAPRGPMSGSPDGIGAYSRLYETPTPSASRNGVLGTLFSGSPLIRGIKAVSGLGDDAAPSPSNSAAATTGAAVEAASGILVAAVAVGLVLTGVGSYYVGKAVAPSREQEMTYAWWGVAAGLLAGPIGLGIESMIALNHKGR